jgi:hypothetical protein
MKKIVAFVLSAAALLACAHAARAFQGGAGRTNQPADGTGGGGSGGRGRGTRTNTPPAPTPPPPAQLSVHVNLPGSAVELDGKDLGPTDGGGYLRLSASPSGQHTLVVRKSGYYEYRQVLRLASGHNGTLEVTLPPRPGRLSVRPNLPGASISVAGVGSYDGAVESLELTAGTYRVSVKKLGYAALEQDVAIEPGISNNVTMTLTRLPHGELAALAESEFQAGRYAQAVTLGEMALEGMPSDPQLVMLLGISHFRLDDLSVSLNYLQQALALGQTLNLNVKHFHKLKKGEGFCQGQLILRRGVLEFRSGENPSESFAVPLGKVIGARPDPDKGWRVSMQVMLPDPKKKNKKEKGFDYSFHPAQAYLQSKDPRKRNSPMLVVCYDCQPMAMFIYQLILQAGR